MKKKVLLLLIKNLKFQQIICNRDAIKAVERAADVRRSALASTEGTRAKEIVRGIRIDTLYRSDSSTNSDIALSFNEDAPILGDRVINLSSTGVPFGLRGTVVTIHKSTGYVEVNE